MTLSRVHLTLLVSTHEPPSGGLELRDVGQSDLRASLRVLQDSTGCRAEGVQGVRLAVFE